MNPGQPKDKWDVVQMEMEALLTPESEIEYEDPAYLVRTLDEVFADLKKLLAANQNALESLDAALAKGRCQFPLDCVDSTRGMTDGRVVVPCIELTRLLRIRAILALREGQADHALATASTLTIDLREVMSLFS